ncbi:MAG: LytR/AlgR family response regulator transcription factor [Vicingaceae bacterium]
MNKQKAIIVEDEKLARDLVKNYLSAQENIELIGEFADGFSGLKAINELKPDIVFLDVQMPKLTGLELLELVEENPHIIFTTAYDAYAIKAFDLNAVDYLLKPFSKERFNKALDKVFEKIEGTTKTNNVTQLKNHIAENKVLDKIVVKSNSNIHVIPLAEVIYIESEDDYVMIHTNKGKHLKHQTMKFYEQQLDANKFIRIHRSFIVNVSEINKIEKFGKESYQVVLKNGAGLKVSRSRYQELKTLLGI